MVLLALTALLTFLASALASFTEYLSFKHSVLKAAQFAFQRSMVFYLPEYPTHRASEAYTWLCCTVWGKRAYPQVLVTEIFRTFFSSSVCFFPLIYILACIVVIFVILSISSYFSSWNIYFLSCSREDWGSSRLRTHSELSTVLFHFKKSKSILVLIHFLIKYWLSGFLDL